jgi:hypothetical protein
MDSLPEQHIDSLPKGAWEDAYWKVSAVCTLRGKRLPEKEVAEEAGFDSVEDMYFRLKRWGLSGLVPLKEDKARESEALGKKGERKARKFEEKEPLPPAEGAINIFKGTLEMLIGYLDTLRGWEEYLQSERFVAKIEKDGEKHVSGARQEPPEPLTTFIAIESLVGGVHAWTPEMARLLGVLHPSEPVETRKTFGGRTYTFREPDPRQVDMEQLDRALRELRKKAGDVAKLVRGRERLRTGRSTGEVSAREHSVIDLVKERAAEGASDEQILEEVNKSFRWEELFWPLISPQPNFTLEQIRYLRELPFEDERPNNLIR